MTINLRTFLSVILQYFPAFCFHLWQITLGQSCVILSLIEAIVKTALSKLFIHPSFSLLISLPFLQGMTTSTTRSCRRSTNGWKPFKWEDTRRILSSKVSPHHDKSCCWQLMTWNGWESVQWIIANESWRPSKIPGNRYVVQCFITNLTKNREIFFFSKYLDFINLKKVSSSFFCVQVEAQVVRTSSIIGNSYAV